VEKRGKAKMALDIQKEVARLPELVYAGAGETEAAEPSPMQMVSKLGRNIMRVSLSAEALDKRYTELSEQLKERDERIHALADGKQAAEREARAAAMAAIHVMDALDWLSETATEHGDRELIRSVHAAQRDCLRKLAAAGLSEIPADGPFDGALHESIDTAQMEGRPGATISSKSCGAAFKRGGDSAARGVVTAA
jgi:hypothetical protein